MNQQSRRLAALLAFFLFSAKGRADSAELATNDNVSVIMERIQATLQSKPELSNVVPNLAKSQLEDLIQQELTDDEYIAVHSLLANLASQNAHVEVTNPKGITLSSQEIMGGGGRR